MPVGEAFLFLRRLSISLGDVLKRLAWMLGSDIGHAWDAVFFASQMPFGQIRALLLARVAADGEDLAVI